MSASMAVNETDFGKLLGSVEAIKKDLSEVETDMKAINAKVDGILTQIAQVEGGLKVSIWFAGVLGAAAMFGLTKIAPLFLGFLPKV